MKRALCICIIILIQLLFSILYNCIYGFNVGGNPNYIYYVLSLLIGIILSFCITFVMSRIKELKRTKIKESVVILTVVFFVLALLLYYPLNDISSEDTYIEYETEIIEIEALQPIIIGQPDFRVSFLDCNGNNVSVDVNLVVSSYEEGNVIIVRETIGGFGVKKYTLTQ